MFRLQPCQVPPHCADGAGGHGAPFPVLLYGLEDLLSPSDSPDEVGGQHTSTSGGAKQKNPEPISKLADMCNSWKEKDHGNVVVKWNTSDDSYKLRTHKTTDEY